MLSARGSANASAERGGYNDCPKLLRPRRWRFFWLSVLSTFRLPLSLAVIGWGRGAAVLRLLLLLLRGRLTICPLHSFSLTACFTCGSATRQRRDRLTKACRRACATLLPFT